MAEKSKNIVESLDARRRRRQRIQVVREYERQDSRYINPVSGFGSGLLDPMAMTNFAQTFGHIARTEIDSLIKHNWVARESIAAIAEDGTRRWMQINSDDQEKVRIMEEELDRLNIRQRFREAEFLARGYGGSVIVLGAFDGRDVREPLDLDRVRSVSFSESVDRFLAWPQTFVRDPLDPRHGQPETYLVHRISPVGAVTSVVHASRVVRFDGLFLPPLLRINNFGWGQSVIELIREELKRHGVAMQAGASTLQDFVLKVIKISNLQELLAAGNFDAVEERLQEAASQFSMHGFVAIGEDEQIEKQGTPINGLPDLLQIYIRAASAASGVPISRLFGAQAGMLTSGSEAGQSDLRSYYDSVADRQRTEWTPRLRRVIDIVGAPHGITCDDFEIDWLPLWEPTEQERAQTFLTTAQADQIYMEFGVLTPEEITASRFADGEFRSGGGAIVVDPERLGEPDADSVAQTASADDDDAQSES